MLKIAPRNPVNIPINIIRVKGVPKMKIVQNVRLLMGIQCLYYIVPALKYLRQCPVDFWAEFKLVVFGL